MRTHAPFRPDDLVALDGLLEQATAVVTMAEIHAGTCDPRIIGLRHDVDNVIEPAVEFAHWEAERGYRSTYFILHTAPYWQDKPLLERSLHLIAEQGHEIAIHNNALAEASRTGELPELILTEAIVELRALGYDTEGTVAHGDPACYGPDGKVRFVNDQLFVECDRLDLESYKRPLWLESFGLRYDANWLSRGLYVSDSGGRWSRNFEDVSMLFDTQIGQLHLNVHPCWWVEAFESVDLLEAIG